MMIGDRWTYHCWHRSSLHRPAVYNASTDASNTVESSKQWTCINVELDQ